MPPLQKTLPLRPGNCCLRSSCSTHIASSSSKPFHFTNILTPAFCPFLMMHLLRMISGLGSRCPSEVSLGNFIDGCICSPKVFLRHETWNVGKICESSGRSNQYDTLPIL
ncbi:hypothetical protein CIPAW_12G066800 [Carya illinoinensis]|uniref:Uncharacterized protein n=1 Tax=Carya illinoinensis TaxID=32201 RepID=A0A8T1NWF9_CARIL|nr:hypothetical protein CIPAW_12G066800 [Carya illinoinensis]